MRKFLKNNLMIIIIILVILGIFVYNFVDFKNNQKLLAEGKEETIAYCESLLSDPDANPELIESCENVIAQKDVELDFFSALSDFVVYRLSFLNPIAFLIVVLPSLYYSCKIIKNKLIINAKTRMNYLDFIKMLIKSAYRYIWILPLLTLILFIFLLFNTSLDSTYSLLNDTAIWGTYILNHPIVFIILYFINIILYSCAFVNLGLIVARKQPKYILTIIFSFLSYIGIELFLELVVNVIIFQNIFDSEIGYLFNIMNMFTFKDTFGIEKLMIFTVGIFVVSCIGVYASYKNQEKFIIDCEKNN